MTREEIKELCDILEHTLHITGQDKDNELVQRTLDLFRAQIKILNKNLVV